MNASEWKWVGREIMGGAIAWSSRKLKVLAQSSTEAEICAGVNAAKDITFIRNVLTFLGLKPSGPTPLVIDNEGMWHNVRNAVTSARTRHFALWQQYVRQCYMGLKLTVHLVNTDDEYADILTKALAKSDPKFKLFRNSVMNIATTSN